ncbi:MAG: glycosyltransferase, partial [Candidatus Micrarchaeota archaeon]
LNLIYSGPLINKVKQTKHKYKYVVPGNLEKQLKPILGNDAVYGWQHNILKYYSNCEMVFCHGGHTTIMEALSYGKPVISIVDSAYSERVNNAKQLQELGVGVYLDKNSVSENSIRNAIDYAKTLNPKRLQLYSKMASKSPLEEFDKLFYKCALK